MVLSKKKVGCGDIIKKYGLGVKLTLTNYKAIIVIIGFIGRAFNAIVKEYYLTYFFKN